MVVYTALSRHHTYTLINSTSTLLIWYFRKNIGVNTVGYVYSNAGYVSNCGFIINICLWVGHLFMLLFYYIFVLIGLMI